MAQVKASLEKEEIKHVNEMNDINNEIMAEYDKVDSLESKLNAKETKIEEAIRLLSKFEITSELIDDTEVEFITPVDNTIGIKNKFNNCFLNSILQSLAFIPGINELLKNQRINHSCFKNTGYCGFCEIQNVIWQILHNKNRDLEVTLIMQNIESMLR